MALSTITIHNIETSIADYPIYQYAFFRPQEIMFNDRLRTYCKWNCPHYKTSWSCPPAIDHMDTCIERCLSYQDGLFFSSIKTALPGNLSEKLGPQQPITTAHEQLTSRVESSLTQNGLQLYTLTSSVCDVCRQCTYPKHPCKFPELMHPCIESHGISIAQLADLCGMDYYFDEFSALKFSVIFIRGV